MNMMPLSSLEAPDLRRIRRLKFVRFLICQMMALGLVAASAALAISRPFTSPSLTLTFTLLTVAGAIAAAIIPILFYALPAKLPRS